VAEHVPWMLALMSREWILNKLVQMANHPPGYITVAVLICQTTQLCMRLRKMFVNGIQARIEGALLPQGWMLHSGVFIQYLRQEYLGLRGACVIGAPRHGHLFGLALQVP
jgi:hypothetical protein